MSEISLSFNSGTIISVDMPMSSAKDILNDFKNYLSGGEPTVREYQTNSPTRAVAGAECNSVIELKLEHHAA